MATEEASAPVLRAASAPVKDSLPGAWQPFTPRGVAGFALASATRLALVQLAVALVIAAGCGWFVGTRWFPVITAATRQLPATGEIQFAELRITDEQPRILAEGRFLALTIDLQHAGSVRPPAHILVEFGRRDILFLSLFGKLSLPYEQGVIVSFNQPELAPWWGAWAPPILALFVLGTVAGLIVAWMLLATLYSGPVFLLAFFANRDCGFASAWRLAGAALLPGAVLLGICVILHAHNAINLLELLMAWALHFVVGWIYLIGAVCYLPRASIRSATNPFST